MIQLAVPPASSQLRRAFHWLRDQLDVDTRVDRSHVEAVQTVADVLLGATLRSGVRTPVTLSVELFARLTRLSSGAIGGVAR